MRVMSSRSNKILFTLLGALGVFIVLFLSLTAYYAWQIKSGRMQNLEERFGSASFTLDPARTQASTPTAIDVRPYLRPTNPTRGSTKAPITIVAFIDFECPFCQAGYPLFQKIMNRYSPVALIIFKQFPIAAIHPNSTPAANAAACAGEQGKFWPYYDLLFQTKKLERDALLADAHSLKLNQAQFMHCLDSGKYQGAIDKDTRDGVDLGVRGTPTYFVNGIKIEGVVDEAVWDRIMLQEIQKVQNKTVNN